MGRESLKHRPESLGQVIKDYLVRSGLARQMGTRKLADEWVDLVGPELAGRTRVVGGLRAGVLHVQVDSPGLLAELKNFRSGELLDQMRLRHKRSHIRKLDFSLGSWESK